MENGQEPILILHGWGASSESWGEVKSFLEGRGYRVFAPDLPGFGKAQPPQNPWSTDNYVEWVKGFCEKEDLSQVFLLGHSFGGGLALKFTAKYPEKVSRLILVAPAIKRQKQGKQYFYFALSKIGRLIFYLPPISFLKPLARRVLYRFIGTRDYYKLDPEKDSVMKETFKKVIRENLVQFLPRVSVPALIVWGNIDKIIPFKDSSVLKEGIRGSELVVIPDMGHAPNLKIPRKLSEIIIEFLRK